jgi:hypothetical protein
MGITWEIVVISSNVILLEEDDGKDGSCIATTPAAQFTIIVGSSETATSAETPDILCTREKRTFFES